MAQQLPKIRLTLFGVAALVILWMSLDASPWLPKEGPLSWDKSQHALAYGALTLLGGWALAPLFQSKQRAWRYAMGIAVGYGVLLEVLQVLLTRCRQAQLGDVLADAFGALVVYALVRLSACRHLQGEQKGN